MNVISTLLATVKKVGHNSTALVLLKEDNEQIVTYTWQEYLANAQCVAQVLRNFKLIKNGEQNFFAVIPLNTPESFFALLGIIAASGIPVPINVPLIKGDKKELKAILDDCQPVKVFANEKLTPHLADITHLTFEQLLTMGGSVYENGKWQPQQKTKEPFFYQPAEGNNLLILPYTSGTTGNPKGVMISHNNVLDRIWAVTHEFAVTPVDRLLCYLPLGHIAELIASFFGGMQSGHTVFFTTHSNALDREELKKNFQTILQKVQPTIFLAVPKIWEAFRQKIEQRVPIALMRRFFGRRILRELGLDKACHCVSAAAKISPETVLFFKELGLNLTDIYGQTETTGPLLVNGKPLGNLEIKLDYNNEGELQARGQCIMLGYYGDNAATAAVFENQFYKTSDSAEWNQRTKRLIFKGRQGRNFKLSSGEFISGLVLQAMEEKIRSISGVDEAVIGGESRPYLVALIFTKLKIKEQAELKSRLARELAAIGKGLYRIGNFVLLDSEKDLIATATEKTKEKVILQKFKDLIEKS